MFTVGISINRLPWAREIKSMEFETRPEMDRWVSDWIAAKANEPNWSDADIEITDGCNIFLKRLWNQGAIQVEWRDMTGRLHNLSGPAYMQTGEKWEEAWYVSGVRVASFARVLEFKNWQSYLEKKNSGLVLLALHSAGRIELPPIIAENLKICEV